MYVRGVGVASWATDILGGGCGHTKGCRKVSKLNQIVMKIIHKEGEWRHTLLFCVFVLFWFGHAEEMMTPNQTFASNSKKTFGSYIYICSEGVIEHRTCSELCLYVTRSTPPTLHNFLVNWCFVNLLKLESKILLLS